MHPTGYFEREYFELHPGKILYLNWLVSLLRTYDVPDGPVLDVGSGYGFLLQALEMAGYEPYGLELSPDATEQAHQRTQAHIETGSAEDPYPYPDDRFAAITMLDVIEHLDRYQDSLRSCYRTLVPGGKIFVITLNAGSLARPILGKSWSWHLDDTHIHMFNGKMLRQGLEQVGFRIEHLTTISNFCSAGEGNPILKPLRRIRRVISTPILGDSLLAVARKPS